MNLGLNLYKKLEKYAKNANKFTLITPPNLALLVLKKRHNHKKKSTKIDMSVCMGLATI